MQDPLTLLDIRQFRLNNEVEVSYIGDCIKYMKL